MPVYTFANIQTDIQDLAHGNRANLKQERRTINRAVREVLSRVDLRSTKRRSQLSPSLFKKVYQYTKPSDLKAWGLIDIKAQIDREGGYLGSFDLTTPEEFDRVKRIKRNMVAVDDRDFVGTLLVSSPVDDDKATLHNMDSLTDNGTWSAVSGTAAKNLTRDVNNFIQGSASINFDSDTSGTDISIENSDMTAIDLTDFEGEQIFMWSDIPLTGTDLDKISNIQLRWGSSSSAYYQRQATVNNEGLSFENGYNLVRLDWDGSATTVGSPDITALNYLRITINLSSAIASATDWRVDFIVARSGIIHHVIYYSKYLWQDSGGTYIENSTADTDKLNADTEEYDLILARIDYIIARSLREKPDVIKRAKDEYDEAIINYQLKYPSEAKTLITTYHRFNSLEENMGVLSSDTSDS